MSFPRPRSWLGLSFRRGFATARDIITPVSVATLLVVLVLTPVLTLSTQTQEQQSGDTALTQISVSPAPDSGASGIITSTRDEIESVPGVASVIADASISVYAADGGTWSLLLHPLNPANIPPDVDLDGVRLSEDEVIVPSENAGEDLAAYEGSELPVGYTRRTGENQGETAERDLNVVASYDPSWQGYGPGAALGSERLVAQLLAAKSGLRTDDFLRTAGMPRLIVTADSADDVTRVAEEIRQLHLTAVPVRDSLGALPGVFEVFPYVLLVVGIGAVLLLVVQLTRIVRASLSRRAEEFALLRVRSWSRADVSHLTLMDTAMGGAIGSLVGSVLGASGGVALVTSLTDSSVSTTVTFAALEVPAAVVVVTGFCVTVSMLSARRVLREDPFITVMARDR